MRRLNRTQSQIGLTLVELLVALVASLVVIAGATSIYLASIRLENDNINIARLTQDLRSMVDVMVRDIRRAGFVSSDPVRNLSALKVNPFFDATRDIRFHWDGACILYSYNRNEVIDENGISNEVPPVVDDSEYLGFRFDSTAGRLEMRQSGSTNEDCSNGDWIALSSPRVRVTELNFTFANPSELSTVNVTSMLPNNDGVVVGDACPSSSTNCQASNAGNGFCDVGEVCTEDCESAETCLQVRTITIRLTAEVVAVPGLTQTITHQVRLRNDKFLEALP